MLEVLKATKAREITKESVTESQSLVVDGVQAKASQSPMQAGDFYLRPTVVSSVTEPSWFRRVVLRKSARQTLKVVTTIVLSCPVCGLPILTSPAHQVIQRVPLTIAREIACPYAPAGSEGGHAFSIKDGNIIAA
jgi:hypothetical protein